MSAKPDQTLRKRQRRLMREQYVEHITNRKKVAALAPQISDQEELNRILLLIPNRVMRREVYELMRKFILKFSPSYPEHVATPHAVAPYDPVTPGTRTHG